MTWQELPQYKLPETKRREKKSDTADNKRRVKALQTKDRLRKCSLIFTDLHLEPFTLNITNFLSFKRLQIAQPDCFDGGEHIKNITLQLLFQLVL